MDANYIFDEKTKILTPKNYINGNKTNETIQAPGGLGKFLFNQIKKHANKGFIAQIKAETNTEETYQTFLTKCIKLALFMKDQGIQQGDIISMCSQNNMDNSPVFIASFFLGVIIASTDPVISAEDTRHLLGLIKPKMIFVCEKSLDLIQKATEITESCKTFVETKIITIFKDNSLNFDNIPDILTKYTENDIELFEPVHVEDTKKTAIILFSSGTTGMPKGTCLSHDALEAVRYKNPLYPEQAKLLGFSTLYWYSGAVFTLVTCSLGLIKVNLKQFNSKTIWDDIKNLQINFLYLSYSHAMNAIQVLGDDQKFPELKTMMIVGGQIAINFFDEYKKKLPKVLIFGGYGMTELGGVSFYFRDSPPGSAGMITENCLVKIVDPETEQSLNLNQTGEIRVKSKYEMNGYYNQNSTHYWDEQGFFKTGDVGYLNDEYNLYVVDRIKEMFKYRSWHVIPAKIERVLRQHPAVLHGIVVGIPVKNDREYQDDNHALGLVVLRDGESVEGDELVKFINEKMDDVHQLRAGVKFILEEDIPYTTTGKINRRKLTQIYS